MTALILITNSKPTHHLGNEERGGLRDKDKLKSNSLASSNYQSRMIHLLSTKTPLGPILILLPLHPYIYIMVINCGGSICELLSSFKCLVEIKYIK